MTSVPNIVTGGSYDIMQAVFQLSMWSGAGQDLRGDAATIQDRLLNRLTGLLSDDNNRARIGPWSLAWGPCVFQALPVVDQPVADNVMYVVRNEAASCYVVAVAGTNPDSKYDLDQLDEAVKTIVSFPLGISPRDSTQPATVNVGNVSAGAALGTTNLLDMRDLTTGKTLQEFLNRVANRQAAVIFTGHSLGGSLSPTLAYWLYPTPSSSSWRAVYVVPTAAPSTGDQGFVTGFTAAFPPCTIDGVDAKYGFFNQLIWNHHDVVPHAWMNLAHVEPYNSINDVVWGLQSSRSLSCQSIHGEVKGLDAVVLYNIIDGRSRKPGTTYVRLADQMFTLPPPPPFDNISFNDFLKISGEQHMNAYGDFFGVPPDVANVRVGISLLAPVQEVKS